MEKTHQSAVVLVPPDDCHPPIQAIRRRHDRQIRRWMPHITLLYPFLKRDRFDEAAVTLQEALSSFSPFTVRLNRFSYFHHGRNRFTIWLSPQPTRSLESLQTLLQQTFPVCNEVSDYPAGFTPHLSVGQVQGKIRLEKTLQALQSPWRPIRFEAREVQIIARNKKPDDRFRIVKTVSFQPP